MNPTMRATVAACLLLFATGAAPAYADARSEAKEQVDFGIDVAQRGLWREAIYRWERAVQIDPTYAEAFNDLAIGYEHEGEFDKARQAYEKAIKLAPNNVQIQQNYELFKEINDRRSTAKEKP
jgi:Flp pilus assembly protein TadD